MTAQMLAQLAPALDGVRVSLHVLAASVWVGGQITVAGLLPATRQLGPGAPRQLARAFSRLSWPAYGALLVTGIWNVAAVHADQQGTPWKTVLGVKVAVVLLAGLAAWLHGHAQSRTWLAVWGSIVGVTSVAALVMGIFLAG